MNWLKKRALEENNYVKRKGYAQEQEVGPEANKVAVKGEEREGKCKKAYTWRTRNLRLTWASTELRSMQWHTLHIGDRGAPRQFLITSNHIHHLLDFGLLCFRVLFCLLGKLLQLLGCKLERSRCSAGTWVARAEYTVFTFQEPENPRSKEKQSDLTAHHPLTMSKGRNGRHYFGGWESKQFLSCSVVTHIWVLMHNQWQRLSSIADDWITKSIPSACQGRVGAAPIEWWKSFSDSAKPPSIPHTGAAHLSWRGKYNQNQLSRQLALKADFLRQRLRTLPSWTPAATDASS